MPQKVVWKPNLGTQSLFLSCPLSEIAYFGTRACGKTDAVLFKFAKNVGRGFGSDYRGLILRRTYPELRDLVSRSKKWFSQIFPTARFNGSDHSWTFETGEILYFSYFQSLDDYWQYQGHEYSFICWEEICNWPTLEGYHLLKSSNRASSQNVPLNYLCTGNTWGSGRTEVKNYWIDPVGTWGVPIKDKTSGHFRVALQGNLIENIPFMTQQEGIEYRKKLLSLPNKELVRSWVNCDWDIDIGSFFADVWFHKEFVVKPFKVDPINFRIYRAFDWGFASPFYVGWFAETLNPITINGVTYDRKTIFLIREWTDTKIPNIEIGRGIAEREKQFKMPVLKGPADNQIWESRGGKSNIADGLRQGAGKDLFVRSDKARISGWQEMINRLVTKKFFVSEYCPVFIRDIESAQRDPKNLDDIDAVNDHSLDTTRYMLMNKRINWKMVSTENLLIY
jgi:hypothetical protein